MTNKQEQSPYCRLSIQVRLDGLSFFMQQLETKEVLQYAAIPFSKRVDAAGLLPEIEHIFKTHEALQGSFKQVEVVYVNALFTLVPQALFQEHALTDYLKFNTKILSTDFVTFDTIDSKALVNVYVPYANVNNFFFDRFGTFDYYHAISKLVAHTATLSLSGNDGHVHINVHPHRFELIASRGKKVLLANVFEYTTKEDFLYYTLFTLEQLELDPDTVQLQLTGHITEGDDYYTALYTYVRNVTVMTTNNTMIDNKDYLLSTLL